MDLVLAEGSALGGVRSKDAVGAAMADDGDSHAAHHTMIDQKGGGLEAALAGEVFDDDRFSAAHSETRLRGGIGGHDAFANQSFLPTYPGAQEHEVAIGQQLQYVAILDFQSLRDEHDHLIQQARKISADHRELPECADHGLLEGAIQQPFLRLLPFLDALAEGFSQAIEGARQLADLAALLSQTGAAAQ